MNAAFKTVSNAIELAMIASSTALMQACKGRAPSAVSKCMRCSRLYSMRSVDHGCWLSHIGTGMRALFSGQGPVFSRGPGQATCVSCVEVLCRVVLYARLHEL